MRLSVVIVNYNVRYFLELCLNSVRAAINTLDAEIIVVDNQSTDASCQMVKQLFPDVTLIENEHNHGFSTANNLGVAEAKGEYICILNPDTVVAEDTFIRCLNFAEGITDLGILGCQLIDGRGLFLPESKRNIPTPKVAIKKMIGFPKSYYANHLEPSENGAVAILVGAFMLLKKEVYQGVNGFDEDYFMYGEDIDLSYKVLKAGYQNRYYGEAAILHFKGESTLKDNIYAKRFSEAMEVFYDKHFKSTALLNVMIKAGIKCAQLALKTSYSKPEMVSKYAVLSENLNFKTTLPFEVEMVKCIKGLPNNSRVFFDSHTISYKRIIATMATSNPKRRLSFRILSNSAQYSIGSDSSQHRGEVVLLN